MLRSSAVSAQRTGERKSDQCYDGSVEQVCSPLLGISTSSARQCLIPHIVHGSSLCVLPCMNRLNMETNQMPAIFLLPFLSILPRAMPAPMQDP